MLRDRLDEVRSRLEEYRSSDLPGSPVALKVLFEVVEALYLATEEIDT